MENGSLTTGEMNAFSLDTDYHPPCPFDHRWDMIALLTGDIRRTMDNLRRAPLPSFNETSLVGMFPGGTEFKVFRADVYRDFERMQGMQFSYVIREFNPHPECVDFAWTRVR